MGSAPPPAGGTEIVLALAEPGGMRRLMGKRGPHRLTLRPSELVVEHPTLRAPLRIPPGLVAVASVDPGSADASRGNGGRFPILHRLAPGRVLPRTEGIEGWVWTHEHGSTATLLGADAPNLLLLLAPPLGAQRVAEAFGPDDLAEIAKRSPHGETVLAGLLLRVADDHAATRALERFGMIRDVTDRDIPPFARRRLPGDKPANPTVGGVPAERTAGSVPPPGAAS